MSLIFSVFLSISLFASNFNQNQPVEKNPLIITAVQLNPSALEPGQTAELKISLKLKKDYHAYLESLKILSPNGDNLPFGSAKVDPLIEFYDPVTKRNKKGGADDFTATFLLEVPLDAAGGVHSSKRLLQFQACTKTFCLFPQEVSFDLQFEVKQTHEAKTERQQPWVYFLAGILSSFTPCVFPMIPITLTMVAQNSNRRRDRLKGLVFYTIGMALTYCLLGLIVGWTGALFGGFLGHPVVAFCLGLLFLCMGLGLTGLYDFNIPSSFQTKVDKWTRAHGVLGSFLTGLGAGVLAGPCVGPVLVTLLAQIGKSGSWQYGVIGMLFYSLGFVQIFFVIGLLEGLLFGKFRSGPWMLKVKKAMGVLIMAVGVYYWLPLLPDSLSIHHESRQMLSWQVLTEESFNKAIASKQPIVIDFYADWCASCKEMDVRTFNNQALLPYKEKITWLRMDATEVTPAFKVWQKKYEILGLPHILFFNAEGKNAKELTLTGFENVEDFKKRLDQLNLDASKKTTQE